MLLTRKGRLSFVKRGDIVMDSKRTLWRKKRVMFVFSEFTLLTRADLSFKWRIDYTGMTVSPFYDPALSRDDHYGLELSNEKNSKKWRLYFRAEKDRDEWMHEFERVIETFNLRELCNEYVLHFASIHTDTHVQYYSAMKRMQSKGELQVRLIAAKNLLAADVTGKHTYPLTYLTAFNELLGLSDPFVSLRLGDGQESKSGTIFKNLKYIHHPSFVYLRLLIRYVDSPVWNEFFSFKVEDTNKDVLVIEVWDYNRVCRSFPLFLFCCTIYLCFISLFVSDDTFTS